MTTPTETTVAPEVVASPPAVVEERPTSALEAATDAALAMPGVPGRDEFIALAMQARVLSMSGAAPEAVRNNPHVALHVAMVGRDLGISPSASLELIDVIAMNGKTQLSLSPQLLNGQIRRLGLGMILPKRRDVDVCIATAVGPRGIDPRCQTKWRNDEHVDDCTCDILGDSEFTWDDARGAGLVGKECKPGEHKRSNDGRCPCNQGYRTYPKRMLWWRASGFAADDYFPEAGLGLYTPEELGAVVDGDGRPIDAASVEVPVGYEPPEREPNASTTPADPDELYHVQMRLMALPEEQRADMTARWNQTRALRGIKLLDTTETQLRIVVSLLRGVESAATAKGWHNVEANEQVKKALGKALTLMLTPGGATERPQTPDNDEKGIEPQPGRQDAPATNEGTNVEPLRTPLLAENVAGMNDAQVTQLAGETAVDTMIALVKAMKLPTVIARLNEHGITIDGDSNAKRYALTMALLRKHLVEVGV